MKVCAKYAEEKVERVLEKFKDKSEFWWKDLVDDIKPRIRYYLDEKSVIKWLTKYLSSGEVEAKTEIADKIVLTPSKIDNLCLKRKFKDTVAVEFEYCSAKVFFYGAGIDAQIKV